MYKKMVIFLFVLSCVLISFVGCQHEQSQEVSESKDKNIVYGEINSSENIHNNIVSDEVVTEKNMDELTVEPVEINTTEESEEKTMENNSIENNDCDKKDNAPDSEKDVDVLIKELDDQIASEYGDYNFSAKKTIEIMESFQGTETKDDVEKLLPYEHHWSSTTSNVYVEHLDYERLVDDCGDIEFNFKSKSYKEKGGVGISYIDYNLTKKHCNEANFNSMYSDISSILGNSQSDSYSGNIRVISWGNYELSTYDYTSWIRFTRIISE